NAFLSVLNSHTIRRCLMKQQQDLTSQTMKSSKHITRRTWPDSSLAMAPCLVAVLALSGAARSGASPQEKQTSPPEASTTLTTSTTPQTRITKGKQQSEVSASVNKELAKPRVAVPYVYDKGDLRALPASMASTSMATVSAATLGLPS